LTRFDELGRAVEMSYQDAEGKLVMTPRGYARSECKYPADGPPIATYFDAENQPLSGEVRVTVLYVAPLSVAARGGIQVGDVLFSYDGHPIRSWFQVPYETNRTAGSEKQVTIELLRNGEPITLTDVDPGRLGIHPDDAVLLTAAPDGQR
jgi:hypothetical protein